MNRTAATHWDHEALLASGVVAVVRLREARPLAGMARALAAGGVGAMEITLTTPGARDAVAELAADQTIRGLAVGAGTVLDQAQARDVLAAGAQFVVSPTLDHDVLRLCRDRGVPYVPGGFTPSELLAAWQAGARIVKLFPAAAAGPNYLRDVLAPMPFLGIVPSGGVSLENAADWIRAGASAVSLGSALVVPAGAGTEDQLTRRARTLVEHVAQARQELRAREVDPVPGPKPDAGR